MPNIDNAPRDTRIFLWEPGWKEWRVGLWSGTYKRWIAIGVGIVNPTHWMPLPLDPPELM